MSHFSISDIYKKKNTFTEYADEGHYPAKVARCHQLHALPNWIFQALELGEPGEM